VLFKDPEKAIRLIDIQRRKRERRTQCEAESEEGREEIPEDGRDGETDCGSDLIGQIREN